MSEVFVQIKLVCGLESPPVNILRTVPRRSSVAVLCASKV